jgi:hypothetical protein
LKPEASSIVSLSTKNKKAKKDPISYSQDFVNGGATKGKNTHGQEQKGIYSETTLSA